MIMTMGWLRGKVTMRQLLVNWLIIYVFNFVACVGTAYFFGYLTGLFAQEPWRSLVKEIAVYKATKMNFGVLFLRAIPANVLVCM